MWKRFQFRLQAGLRGCAKLGCAAVFAMAACAGLHGQTVQSSAVQRSEVHSSEVQRPAVQGAELPAGAAPLLQAAARGDAAEVHRLLADGADVDQTGSDGRTALMVAALHNQLRVVNELIARGADLDRRTRTGSALEIAERLGEPEIAAALLAAGARHTGESVGDTVCVKPWGGDGFCGTVRSFRLKAVELDVTRVVGCVHGCVAKAECSAGRLVGVEGGVEAGSRIAVPSWCLTETGVKP